jgi:hypothetical protein
MALPCPGTSLVFVRDLCLALESEVPEELPKPRQLAQRIVALIGRHPYDERLMPSDALPQELQLEERASWARVPGVVAAAMRG